MKTKSAKLVFGFLPLGLALLMLACQSPLQKVDRDGLRGSISGTVLSVDGVDNGGITVTAEATNGIRSLSVQRALAGISPLSMAAAATATTDSSGAYCLKDLPPGTYTLTATSGDALEKAVSGSVTVTATVTVEAPVMYLTRTGVVAGTVSLSDSASPLGVVVFIAGSSYSAMAAADGSYMISYVPAGSGYTLVASKIGYDSAITSVSVKVAKTTTVAALSLAKSVTPATTGSVSGSVVSSEGPAIPAAFVFLEGSSYICVSSSSGAFDLGGVKPGNYTLTASKQGYDSASVPVSVTAGTATAAGVLTLEPAPVTTPTGPFYVTYDANGATSGSVPVDTNAYMGGSKVTILGNSGNLRSPNSMFVNWNTKADGTGTTYTQGQILTIGAFTSLFAQYETIRVSMVCAGGSHTMILKTDGSLWATGNNDLGQFGNGTLLSEVVPVQVMNDVAMVFANSGYTIILKTDGGLWATGNNNRGVLGAGNIMNISTPMQVTSDVAMVSTGGIHTMVRKVDGSLWATGLNDFGQLGDGSMLERHVFAKVMSDVARISAGGHHTMVLKPDGRLWAVGWNYYGQLGDGTTIDKSTPVQVMEDVVSISSGYAHTMILKTDDSLWAAGWNYYGQLGDGTTIDKSTPVQVMSDVAMISTGFASTMILKTDGSLWGIGDNRFGQLGDGTTTVKNTPVLVMNDVALVSAGERHTMILKADGSLWATGDNSQGQFGDGTTVSKSTPVQVM